MVEAAPNIPSELNALYDLYRLAALNKEYYGCKLARMQRWNLVFEISIAAAASGSGISGWHLWQTQQGVVAWAIITGAVSVLSLLKPFLQLNRKVERYSRLYTGHLDNYLALDSIVRTVQRKETYPAEWIAKFEAAERRYRELSRSDDPALSTKLLDCCSKTVLRRIDVNRLWYPETAPHRPSDTHRDIISTTFKLDQKPLDPRGTLPRRPKRTEATHPADGRVLGPASARPESRTHENNERRRENG